MEKLYDSETGCCPRFDPAPWDGKEHIFNNRLFIKDHVRSIFHIPIDFGKVMVRNIQKIVKADALAPAPFMLCDETAPNAQNITAITTSSSLPKLINATNSIKNTYVLSRTSP
jgi:hypothetical protein